MVPVLQRILIFEGEKEMKYLIAFGKAFILAFIAMSVICLILASICMLIYVFEAPIACLIMLSTLTLALLTFYYVENPEGQNGKNKNKAS